ncbi:hypothetical protein HJO_08814 [Hyphomonas johnsonii MHS-2]|uniref:Uncharacterized protein n=1 Tax=Hyphomonas johnsonii MHS-2 TaxID=1280950 RepID=A0A059FNU6_9PROT|nr:hypothetical protein HJO_08814 [Hyphomonas johnsonii MHS-2]
MVALSRAGPSLTQGQFPAASVVDFRSLAPGRPEIPANLNKWVEPTNIGCNMVASATAY